MRHCNLKYTLFSLLIAAFWAIPAQAATITVQFTATNFYDMGLDSISPPTTSVTGTIVYEADNTNADIESVTSINMTPIDGYTYVISEVGFHSDSIPRQYIGGQINGAETIVSGTTDFRISWHQNTLIPVNFLYTSNGSGYEHALWRSDTFDQFIITASSPVPEPATMLLLGLGLMGVAGIRRKIQK